MAATSFSHEMQRVMHQNTFLKVVSDEDIQVMAVKWSRYSSWPCSGADTCFWDRMDGNVAIMDETKAAPEPVAELAADAANMGEQDCKDCNPCIFFASARGCLHGLGCKFCHVHLAKREGAAKKRARKQTRDKLKSQAGVYGNRGPPNSRIPL